MPAEPTNKTILIIDDDREIAAMLMGVLQSNGHRVVHAQNGVEGQRQIETLKPDLVITDMMMPRTAGPSLIAALLIEDPDVRIIAVSGVNSSEVVRTAKDLGAARFLAKPFTVEVLLRTLHDLLASDAEPGAFTH